MQTKCKKNTEISCVCAHTWPIKVNIFLHYMTALLQQQPTIIAPAENNIFQIITSLIALLRRGSLSPASSLATHHGTVYITRCYIITINPLIH